MANPFIHECDLHSIFQMYDRWRATRLHGDNEQVVEIIFTYRHSRGVTQTFEDFRHRIAVPDDKHQLIFGMGANLIEQQRCFLCGNGYWFQAQALGGGDRQQNGAFILCRVNCTDI